MSLNAVAALVDRRRHEARSEAVARRLADRAHVELTVLEVREDSRPAAPRRPGAALRVPLPADAVGPAAAAHLRSRDGILLVVDAHGGGTPGVLFDGDVEHLLQRLRQPVLVLGPGARTPTGPPRLLVPVDRGGLAVASGAMVRAWLERMPDTSVRVLALDVADPWPDTGDRPPPDDADGLVATLRRDGADVTLTRADGADPVGAVLAACDTPAVVVVTASRWPGGSGHWYATARQLIRHAPAPVLVVPADLTDRGAA